MRALFFIFLFSSFVWADEPITIQIGGTPGTLDPHQATDQYSFGILRNIVTGLFKLDPNGNLQNGLVQSYKVSPDKLTYKFKLNPEARWSDGKTVTVEDCILGLQHVLDPKTASPNVESFLAIRGAKGYYASRSTAEGLGLLKVDNELVIQLEKPDSSFLQKLALPAAAPLRQDVFGEASGKWDFKQPTTGDYILTAYAPDEKIELAPHPFNKIPGQRNIMYRIIQDETTAMNLFESGKLDIVSTVLISDIERLKKKNVLKFAPSASVYYLSFNLQRPPFNDINWRKAILSSVDREGLAKIFSGAYEATSSFIPKGMEGSLPPEKIQYPASVKILKEQTNKPTVKLAYGASAFTKTVGEKIQHDLEKSLGIKVILAPTELKVLLDQLRAEPPDMYFLGLTAQGSDPFNHLNAFSTAAGPNFPRYYNEAYEKLLESFKSTSAGKQRASIAQRAHEIIVLKDIAVIPLLLRTQIFAVSPKLRHLYVSPYQTLSLKDLRK